MKFDKINRQKKEKIIRIALDSGQKQISLPNEEIVTEANQKTNNYSKAMQKKKAVSKICLKKEKTKTPPCFEPNASKTLTLKKTMTVPVETKINKNINEYHGNMTGVNLGHSSNSDGVNGNGTGPRRGKKRVINTVVMRHKR